MEEEEAAFARITMLSWMLPMTVLLTSALDLLMAYSYHQMAPPLECSSEGGIRAGPGSCPGKRWGCGWGRGCAWGCGSTHGESVSQGWGGAGRRAGKTSEVLKKHQKETFLSGFKRCTSTWYNKQQKGPLTSDHEDTDYIIRAIPSAHALNCFQKQWK